ncbi:MAG: DNA methyltransferase [Terriglobia bacterium]
MNDEQRQEIIRLLQQGEELSPEWARILFPPEKREYELVYYGKEREEEIIANTLAVPLQKVRTFGKNGDVWHNKLIFGDNLQVMKSLLELKRAGKLCNADGTLGVRLVYIDPPFASRREFAGTQDQKAYGDKLIGARFVEFMRSRLVLIRELLADDGSIYVHLDEKKSHYMKVILDEVFGEHRFQREIVWRIGWLSGYKTKAKNWIRNHDVILFYSKGATLRFNKQYIPYPADYVRRDGAKPTGDGYPIEDTWNCYVVDRLDSIQIKSFSQEKVGFPTQKNEDLVARIIRSSSNKGDIVLDAFAGSGTTMAVAEKLGRRWIGIDCGKLSIYTVQKRLLNLRKNIGNKGGALTPKPFDLYNAGLYDFSKLKELSWDAWRFFALQLFQCRDETHRIGGIQLDGYLKGASVLVFNHQKQPGVRIDEETIQSMHEALGSKIGNRMFIIAPALVFDFQQDYLTLDGVRYYALRIPYSIIHELHQREFTALKQPADEMAINDTVDAVGFDFIRSPELNYVVSGNKGKGELVNEGVIRIKTFKSEAVVRDSTKKANRETLSMVMLDYDFDKESDVFDLDAVFYAEAIQKADWEVRFPLESVGKQMMAVFVDIYGNEAREVIPASEFGVGGAKAAAKHVRKASKKARKPGSNPL